MGEHTRRVREWLLGHDEVQRWVRGQPARPLLRAGALRQMADKAREQLVGVDFDAVDWEGIVRDVFN
jgi:hypothetical protein